MDKSIINLLQEVSAKQGFVPLYDFTEKKTIENSTQFICNVSCKQLIAHGTGSSKKKAKLNAAENMLLLLKADNKTSLPTSSSSSVADITHSPVKVYEMSQLCKKSNTNTIGAHNYVGMLQEFCQQRKILVKDILYKLVHDEGLPHIKMFTIEVSLGSLREQATAYCKKTAKQEAARKLLLHLNPSVVDPKAAVPNAAVSNSITADLNDRKQLEMSLQELGVGILNYPTNEETLSMKKLSEHAEVLYRQYKNCENIKEETNPSVLKNRHNLFERNYSSKIQHSVREKMRIIRDNYHNQMDLRQIKSDIENLLKMKIQQIPIHSKTKTNHMVCLHLLSNPRITQIGMGETMFVAESRAMYNLITAILIFLNV